MKTVGRLFRADIRTAQFAEQVGISTPRAKRLMGFLKDEQYSVYVIYGLQAKWEGYLVATYQHGDPTLSCHYFEEFVPNALDTVGMALVLDHTGFEYMSCPAPTPDTEEKLLQRGFVLSDFVWTAPSRLFDGVITATEIKSISGDAWHELSKTDKEDVRSLVGVGVYEELELDVRGHYTYTAPIADLVVNRIPFAGNETVVWREGKEIVGVAQIRLQEKGVVILSGVVVKAQHQRKGIGRRLIGALFEYAARHSDTVFIETGACNEAANHLYGNILRCTQVLRTMTLKRNPELVTWKRAKGNLVERAIKDEPSVAPVKEDHRTDANAFLSGFRG
ncbi:hypothetical protein pEaSNUABM29_00049 [Erwinia phage pEa_SNUABM_29]|nr:hypothetical protein pEaSNUABM29_00049 [Erwinia phage pEa_SNUABM_29]